MKFLPEVIPDELIFSSTYATLQESPHKTIRFVMLREMMIGDVNVKVDAEKFIGICTNYKALIGAQIGNMSEVEEQLTGVIRDCFRAEGLSHQEAKDSAERMTTMEKRDALSKNIDSKLIIGKKKPNSKILFELIGVRNIFAHGRVCVILPREEAGIEYESKDHGPESLTLAMLDKTKIEAFELACYEVRNWLNNLVIANSKSA